MIFAGPAVGRACFALAFSGVFALSGCESENAVMGPPTPWVFELPQHFPPPLIPADNPITEEKVRLGRQLFYDFQLSFNGDRSCGICHEGKKGYTDGFVRSVGSEKEQHPRNGLSILNVGFRAPLTWRDPDLFALEEQLLAPLLATEPIVEMGMGGNEDLLLDRLATSHDYPDLFAAAFPSEAEPISVGALGRAIASFQRTVVGADSPYDRLLAGEPEAMGEAALRGLDLFFGATLGCSECHFGPLLDRPRLEDGSLAEESGFYNTGMYNVDGLGSYPPEEPGLIAVTGVEADMGRFRTPSLRNVAETGPWGHDGSFASLGDVIDAYARGGRLVESGPNPGDGALGAFKDSRIAGFPLEEDQKSDLLAFLAALSDEVVLSDPRLADPFCRGSEEDLDPCIVPVMGPGSDGQAVGP